MSIPIKDRDSKTEHLRLALVLCDIGINYETTDLIIIIQKAFKKNPGLALDDVIKIKIKHERKWKDYYKPKDNFTFETMPSGYFYCGSCEEKIEEQELLTDDKCGTCGTHIQWVEFEKGGKKI